MAALARRTNPVRWQEITHQERNAPYWVRRGAALGPVIILAMVVYAPLSLIDFNNPSREFASLFIWIVHAAVATRCIVAGANTVSREHIGLTWDALVLTGVSARRIMSGKWFGALFRVRGWVLSLTLVRVAMIPVFFMWVANRVVWWYFGRYGPAAYSSSYGSYRDDMPTEFLWVPLASILAVVMAIILTLLEAGACTALGMAASALTRRGTTAIVFAMTLRFIPLAVFWAFTRYELGPTTYLWFRFTPFALADSGTSPLTQLSFPLMEWTQGRYSEALPGLLWVTVLLGGLLVASLVGALIAIQRAGALPHGRGDQRTGVRVFHRA